MTNGVLDDDVVPVVVLLQICHFTSTFDTI